MNFPYVCGSYGFLQSQIRLHLDFSNLLSLAVGMSSRISFLLCHTCANACILSFLTRLHFPKLLFSCCQGGSNALSSFMHPGWKQSSSQGEADLISFYINIGLDFLPELWPLLGQKCCSWASLQQKGVELVCLDLFLVCVIL